MVKNYGFKNAPHMKNYALLPPTVIAREIRNMRQRRIGLALLAFLCAVVVALGVAVGLNFAWQHDAEGAASRYVRMESVSATDAAGDEQGDVAWAAMDADGLGAATAWIRVASRNIDFAVAQWGDNEYGLHHDLYGNPSWAGVFLDCDCDADGRNRMVYGHTLYGGGMFSDLATSRNQDDFDTIGSVQYCTRDVGWQEFTSVAAVDVDATDMSLRQFTFDVDEDAYKRRVKIALDAHKAAGDVNVTVGAAGVRDASVKYVRNASTLEDAIRITSNRYYELTEDEKAAIRDDLEAQSWRAWAQGFVARADAKAQGAEHIVSRSHESVVLACCSWPFRNKRCLILAVR